MKGWGKTLAVAIGAPLILFLFVIAFMWPNAKMEPEDMPVAIAGDHEQVQQVEQGLNEKKPGLLEFKEVSDRDAAEQSIKERETYGAIVLGDQPEVLTSSAASTASNGIMTGLADGLEQMANQQAQAKAAQMGVPADQIPPIEVGVDDVAPLTDNDPNGMGMSMIIMPLSIGTIIGSALCSFVLKRKRERLVAIAIYAPLAGLLASTVLGPILSLVPEGHFWANMGVFTAVFAVLATAITGLKSLIGPPGFGFGVIVVMLLGAPLAAAAYPHEFLPNWADHLGQNIATGVGAWLLRTVNYFPEASMSGHLWKLVGWFIVGLILYGIAALVHRDRGDKDGSDAASADEAESEGGKHELSAAVPQSSANA